MVVEADSIDNIYALRYPDKMVAYVSVGEIEPWRKTKTPYDKSWVISENKTWSSLIADLNKEAYQDFIFERVATLYEKGYRNFFLDTMDAYHVTQKDKELFKSQQKAIVSFVHKLHQKYPKSKIILNRGFELLDQIHNDITAVAAESLLKRYDHSKKAYINVPKNDRTWLLAQFKKAKKHHLEVISIEYSDASSKERREIAKKIKEMGFIPYVTDGLLQEQGECEVARIRRNVLILFNQSYFKDSNPVYSDVHLMLAMPLEHFGYIPTLYDISTQKLPTRISDKYHAVVVWSDGATKNDENLYAFTNQCKKEGIKILFLNSFRFNPTAKRLASLDIKYKENKHNILEEFKVHYQLPYKAYEIPASPEYNDKLIDAKNSKSILRLKYKNGDSSIPIAITNWGGYALGNSYMLGIGNQSFWTIDPFTFLKEALGLTAFPIPDPTTEAGRRILFVHIDGDGFMEPVRGERDMLSAEYLLENIYKKYPIPQTVSLIQGEVDSIGLYPKLSTRMKKIARKLYRIPWIQPASHTLSHPFFWHEAKEHGENEKFVKGEGYHLPLPNYRFSLERETKGSVNFALNLAPKSKRKEKLLFWSGDCLPTRKVLAYIERQGIMGLNGGDTTIQKKDPWLSYIAPFGLQHGEYWQVYTGQQNENVYTNEWTGPFWAFRNVIDTYKMTEKPYRLKPINLYYHIYAASKVASKKALHEVYEWVMNQKTSKLKTAQYIKKGQDFYHTVLARKEGGFEIRNQGHLRTFRFDKKININIEQSQGVAGWNYEGDSTYITLDKREKHFIKLTNYEGNSPYLIEANGWVEKVNIHNNHYRFKLKAHMPIRASFFIPKNCKFQELKGIKSKKKKNIFFISSSHKKGVDVVFKCQQQ